MYQDPPMGWQIAPIASHWEVIPQTIRKPLGGSGCGILLFHVEFAALEPRLSAGRAFS